MSNTLAISLGTLIAAFVGLDLWLDSGMVVFLVRKFVDLIAYLAFWR